MAAQQRKIQNKGAPADSTAAYSGVRIRAHSNVRTRPPSNLGGAIDASSIKVDLGTSALKPKRIPLKR